MTKDLLQAEALKAVTANDYSGTLIMSMGVGKSAIMYMWINRLRDDGIIPVDSKGLIFSQTEKQGQNLAKEQIKYEQRTGHKVTATLDFKCYASMCTSDKYAFVCYDEHSSLPL